MADGAELIANLAHCKLFEDLSQAELAQVADSMDEDHFPGNTQILKEGEQGMGFFFVVLDGSATVVQHGKEVAVLKQGDFFGEVTSLNGGPRTASVTTNEPLWVVRLTDSNFRPFLERFPKVTFRVLERVLMRFQALATNAGS
ncbi:MAG: family transcriptional regulator, cyclic receptor protein [Chloroflexota bacterium]|jgi:CRP-like cAMP-binding protein|nr:family transcriptional regulator, cyclic receptor protein [Chloroflexota bacterium]